MVGKELAFDPSLGRLERVYVRIFGAPISGFRIRYRRLMPVAKRLVSQILEEHGGERASILDAGCGPGLFCYAMAREFPTCRVLGIDNMEDLVNTNNEISKRAGLGNCRFEMQDILGLSQEDEYDLVVCIDNLEHIEDDTQALEKLYRCLKRRGLALIHVPGLYMTFG